MLFAYLLVLVLAATGTNASHITLAPGSNGIIARSPTYNYESAREQNANLKFCHQYRRKVVNSQGVVQYNYGDYFTKSYEECHQQCGEAKPGISQTCGHLGFDKYEWYDNQTLGVGVQSAVTPCICDDKDMEQVAEGLLKVFKVVGDVVCDVWVGILTGLVDSLINTVIDTAESAISAIDAIGGLDDNQTKVIQGALGLKSQMGNMDQSRSAFGKWVASKVCSNGALTQNQTNEIFDTIDKINQMVITIATVPVGGAGVFDAFRLGSPIGRTDDDLNNFIDGLGKLKDPPDHVDNPIPKDKPATAKLSDLKSVPKTAEPATAKPTEKTSDAAKETSTLQHTTDKPADKTTDKSADKTSEKTSHTTSACNKNKRADGNDDCATSTSTVVEKSHVAAYTTSTYTCDGNLYPQACAHYYSVIKRGARSIFTCYDNADRQNLKNGATTAWLKSHGKGWRTWATKSYSRTTTETTTITSMDGKVTHVSTQTATFTSTTTPACDMDEWPPAYFMPTDYDGSLAKFDDWKQYMRWLPGRDNRGASKYWKGFCADHDGGSGNGQYLKKAQTKRGLDGDILELEAEYHNATTSIDDEEPLTDHKNEEFDDRDIVLIRRINRNTDGPLNSRLVDYENQPTRTSSRNRVVTEYYADVPFTRAVFSMAFHFPITPTQDNDWLLRDNACWPKDIVPDDPGFVLPVDDPWYRTAEAGRRAALTTQLYKGAPDEARSSAADTAWQVRLAAMANAHKRAYPDDPWNEAGANVTRPMTLEELKEAYRYIPPSVPERNTATPTSMVTIIKREETPMVGESAPVLPTETGSIH